MTLSLSFFSDTYAYSISLHRTGTMTHLRGTEPLVLFLKPVHGDIELVQKLVAKEIVINQVELTTSVRKRVAVAFAWEVHPFRMTELVAFKVEVRFAAKGVNDEAESSASSMT